MSDLIAAAYPDRATAEKVREELARLTQEHVIDDLMKEVGRSLPEGGAALFTPVRQAPA